MKWVGFVAALIAVSTFVFNLFTGFPFNRLLSFWDHRIVAISFKKDFDLEALYNDSGDILNTGDKFSYKFDLPWRQGGFPALANNIISGLC